MLWLVALAGLARAECDNGALADALAEARARYAAVDEAGFRDAMARSEAALACMREPVRRPNVAEWHRTTALLVAVDGGAGSRERVIAGLRAGLEIDPTLSIFPGALPENYWVARYDEARALTLGAAVPLTGPVVVDGVSGGSRRAGLPALVQCLDDGGGVQWTRVIGADEPAPACVPAPAPAPAETSPVALNAQLSDPCEGRLSRGATWGLVGAAGAFALGSAGLYLWNDALYDTYTSWPATGDRDAYDAQRVRVNAVGAASVASGALAAGLAVPVVVKGCFGR